MCRDKPYSKFKPGQTSLSRDYYKDATQEKVCGNASLENYNRFKSDYGKNTSENAKVGDYVVPSQDANTLRKFDCQSNLILQWAMTSETTPNCTNTLAERNMTPPRLV